MKKKHVLLLLLVLFSALFLVGCSSSDSGDGGSQTSDSTAGIDESLTGLDLLNSLDITPPDTLTMTSVTSGILGSNTTDMTMTTMVQGDNTRMETEVPDVGNQIIIYNASEGVTYQYVEGQTTGIMFSDTDLSMDDEEYDTEDELTTSIFDLTEDMSGVVDARVETLNGETVIYIETTDDSSGEGTMNVKMWYSTEYGVPLKYELYSQDELVASTEVTNISSDPIDSSMFQAPADVEFTDFAAMNFDDMTLDDLNELYGE